jgi:MFS family permease
MIIALSLFAAGSAVSGSATTSTLLLCGRIIQGIGGAGIGLLTQIIISGLVSVRERSKYISIIFVAFIIGTGLGPIIGGMLLQRISWRWIFFINIPIACVTICMLCIFLPHPPHPIQVKGTQLDLIGNLLLIASVTAMLIGLSYGGSRHSWSSAKVLIPIILGFLGLITFGLFEASHYCTNPILPPQILLCNRTTVITLILSVTQFMFSYWIIYFLPVYFQGVLLASPEQSGVFLLPTVLFSVPISILFGYLMTKVGRYKPIHIGATGSLTLGLGLFAMLNSRSSLAEVVVLQCIAAGGFGILMTTVLPAVQGSLPEKDTAIATAAWGFLRAVGGIWGVGVPATIFDNQFQKYLVSHVSNAQILDSLNGGSAYARVSGSYIKSLPLPFRAEVISTYVDALKIVWAMAAGLSGISFLLCFLEKEIPMRTTNQARESDREIATSRGME